MTEVDIDPNIQKEISDIVEMHKIAATHREKAELERWVRDRIGMNIKTRGYLCNLLNTNFHVLQAHSALYTSGSEFVWSLVDEESVALHTANTLLRDARRQATISKRPIDDVLRELYKRNLANAVIYKTPKGHISFRYGSRAQRDKSVKFAWANIHDAIREIIKRDMGKLDPIMHDRFVKDLEIDIKVLIKQYKTRVISNVKNGVLLEDKASKRKFMSALSNLDLPKPKVIDQEYGTKIRRIFRRKLADHHPDKLSGDNGIKHDHVNNRFNEMQEMYTIVEDYLTSHGVESALK